MIQIQSQLQLVTYRMLVVREIEAWKKLLGDWWMVITIVHSIACSMHYPKSPMRLFLPFGCLHFII